MSNPAPFINSPPPRRGPGCWVIGGATCLVVLILGAIAIVGGTYSFLHSPSGHKAGSAFGKIFAQAQDQADCLKKMQAIHDAVVKYHADQGTYPKDLTVLVPKYLPDTAALHCPSDGNSDPKHDTFVYTRPPEGAPAATPILAVTTTMTISLQGITQINETTITMTLDGKISQSQTITQNGRTIRRTTPF